MNGENQDSSSSVTLWNPNAAACWSLLFTPTFGAWLHAKNWATLGNAEKAKQSMYWAYGGIALSLIVIFIPGTIARPIGIGYLMGWYISSAKPQIDLVKNSLNGNYVKNSWAKPLGAGAAYLICLFLLTMLIVIINPNIIPK